jgi:allantoicase
MGDGWETKRSRQKGHKDWVIIKLQVAETSQSPMS